jgi:hypothetical protein
MGNSLRVGQTTFPWFDVGCDPKLQPHLFGPAAAGRSGALPLTGCCLKPALEPEPPLDKEVKRLMNDPRINVHLTPVQRIEKRAAPVQPTQNQSGAPLKNNSNKRPRVDTPRCPAN